MKFGSLFCTLTAAVVTESLETTTSSIESGNQRFLRSSNDLAPEINKDHQFRHSRKRRDDEEEDHFGFMINFHDMSLGEEDFLGDFGEFVTKNYAEDGLSFMHLEIPESLAEDVLLELRSKSYVHSVEHELLYHSKALYWNKGRVGSTTNSENYVGR
eukprot:Awhi_evm1s7413